MSDVKPNKTLFLNLRGNGDRNVSSWTKIQGATVQPGPCAIEFVHLLKEGGEDLKGEGEFYARIEELGQCVGEYHAMALYDAQQIIPSDRKGKILVFPGTMRLNPKGEICVPCMNVQRGKWVVTWRPIKRQWTGQYRVAREPALTEAVPEVPTS